MQIATRNEELVPLALALNNNGVTLLRQGFLHDALHTLRESIGILRMSFSQSSSMDCENEKPDFRHTITRDLAKLPRTCDRSLKSPSVAILSHDEIDVHTIQSTFVSVESSVPCCIRINTSDSPGDIDDNFATGIVMYNLAITYVVQALALRNMEMQMQQRGKLLQAANKLLHMTAHVLFYGCQETKLTDSGRHFQWCLLSCLTQSQDLALGRMFKELNGSMNSEHHTEIEASLLESLRVKQSHVAKLQAELTEMCSILYPATHLAAAA